MRGRRARGASETTVERERREHSAHPAATHHAIPGGKNWDISQFTAPLLITPLNDGKSWVIITDDFKYDIGYEGSGDSVDVPLGMISDFASVPQPIWWFAAPWGTHGHAAVIHDAGYYIQDRSRREYDRIFLEAMEVLEVGRLKRRLMYLAVRWFGGPAWSANASRNRKKPGWKIIDPTTLGLSSAGTVESASSDAVSTVTEPTL